MTLRTKGEKTMHITHFMTALGVGLWLGILGIEQLPVAFGS